MIKHPALNQNLLNNKKGPIGNKAIIKPSIIQIAMLFTPIEEEREEEIKCQILPFFINSSAFKFSDLYMNISKWFIRTLIQKENFDPPWKLEKAPPASNLYNLSEMPQQKKAKAYGQQSFLSNKLAWIICLSIMASILYAAVGDHWRSNALNILPVTCPKHTLGTVQCRIRLFYGHAEVTSLCP